MCGDCAPRSWTRRRVMAAGGAVAVGGVWTTTSTPAPARTTPAEPLDIRPRDIRPRDIRPRDAWGADLPPTGPIEPEPDVRFLLVHHTASSNDYAASDVPGIIRAFHSFHTGPEKGWPDVAYNFLVDRFGTAWEARAGSIAGAVRGSATGGNQGFDQKCSFIGDHSASPPTAAAQATMVALLALLADRHGIDTQAGATTTFTSLGSNRHPTGAVVTTATIEGHRSMSTTACPGDAAYALVTSDFPAAVTAARGPATPTTTSTTTTSTTTSTSTTSTTTAPATSTPRATTTSTPTPSSTEGAAAPGGGDGGVDLPAVGVGAAGLAVVGAALVALRRRLDHP